MVFSNSFLAAFSLLWSSFFVTLVAKKYRLATMLPFVPRMVCDSRWSCEAYMIIVNVCKFFYLLIECFLCCKLIQICAFILQGIEVTLHRALSLGITCVCLITLRHIHWLAKSVNALDVYCEPWSECRINSPLIAGWESNAFCRVRMARSLVMCDPLCWQWHFYHEDQ